MVQEYFKKITPCVRTYEANGNSNEIANIDILEITPETNCRIAHHAGEDGTVFADTRVIMPARYRAIIAFPESDALELTDYHKNLLNASHTPLQKYTVASYYSKCWDMVVTSSRNRDTPEMVGLRVQEVMFEECLKYENSDVECANAEDASTEELMAQYSATGVKE